MVHDPLSLFPVFVSVTSLNYSLSITAVTLMFIFYTRPVECVLNRFFISFNLILCFIASVISLQKKVRVSEIHIYIPYKRLTNEANRLLTGCPKSQEPLIVKLHVYYNFVFIIYNTHSTHSLRFSDSKLDSNVIVKIRNHIKKIIV